MKLAFQCLLVVTMLLSLIVWWISTAKLHISSRLPDFSNYHGKDWEKTFSEWSSYVDKPIIQQTTHADETFWVCMCAFILTMKVR